MEVNKEGQEGRRDQVNKITGQAKGVEGEGSARGNRGW